MHQLVGYDKCFWLRCECRQESGIGVVSAVEQQTWTRTIQGGELRFQPEICVLILCEKPGGRGGHGRYVVPNQIEEFLLQILACRYAEIVVA